MSCDTYIPAHFNRLNLHELNLKLHKLHVLDVHSSLILCYYFKGTLCVIYLDLLADTEYIMCKHIERLLASRCTFNQ